MPYAMSDMFYRTPGTIPPMVMPFDPTASVPLCLVTVSNPDMDEKNLHDVLAVLYVPEMLDELQESLAPVRQAESEVLQAVAGIQQAWADVRRRELEVERAEAAEEEAATGTYPLSLQRIRGGEGLPIELLQAIRARANAQNAYTKAVTSYNRAQFRLLRATGQPPRFEDGAGRFQSPRSSEWAFSFSVVNLSSVSTSCAAAKSGRVESEPRTIAASSPTQSRTPSYVRR